MFTAALFLAAAAAQPAPNPMSAAPPADHILTEQPSAAAEALGQDLARSGTLAALLPLQAQAETAQMLADHPGLTPAEQETLRTIAARTAEAGTARLLATLGHAYAQRLSEADMRALIAFEATPAAASSRAAMPHVMAATMQAMGAMDFKGETLAAFCKETGKGCADD